MLAFIEEVAITAVASAAHAEWPNNITDVAIAISFI